LRKERRKRSRMRLGRERRRGRKIGKLKADKKSEEWRRKKGKEER
jgi:hypothetical protein